MNQPNRFLINVLLISLAIGQWTGLILGQESHHQLDMGPNEMHQMVGHNNNNDNTNGDSISSEESTNYGERLSESSYSFTNTFAREPKEESNIYSSGINAILNSDGFLNHMEKLGGNDPKYTPQGPVEMAVHSKKTIEVIPVKFEEPKDGEPQVIEISPYEVPVSIVFKTQTNKLHVNQEHKSEPAEEVKEINSEEEPHRVVHNVYRPVIQEVTEVVQPFRKVVQKVEPVIEEMKTIISKAGPPDAAMQHHQPQQQQSFFGASASRTGGFNFGNEQAGLANNRRFTDYHLSGYGSEVVNKMAPAPPQLAQTINAQQSASTQMARTMIPPNLGSLLDGTAHKNIAHRLGTQMNQEDKILINQNNNNNNNNNDGNNNGNNAVVGDNVENVPNANDNANNANNNDVSENRSVEETAEKQSQQTSEQATTNGKSITSKSIVSMDGKSESNAQYNDLIKQYIENLFAFKNGQRQLGNNKMDSLFNDKSSIKIMKIKMKNNQNNNNGNANGGTKSMPSKMDDKKFKIIKEFRISLNDIKKELSKKQLQQQQPQLTNVNSNTNNHNNNNNNNNNGNFVMKPYASFSISGPMVGRQQTINDIGRFNMINRNVHDYYSKNNRVNKKMEDEHRETFNRRQPLGYTSSSNSHYQQQNQVNPLRNYHYMNFKRYGETKNSKQHRSTSSSEQYSSPTSLSKFTPRDGRGFKRRMLTTNSQEDFNNEQWEYGRNPYFDNYSRLISRLGFIY